VLDVMTGLLGSFFAGPTWRPWVLCAAALFGLTYGLDADDQEFIRQCMGRRVLPTDPARRGCLVVGRRGGKTRFTSFLGVFVACFRDYSRVLAPGERGVVMLIAPNQRQARVLLDYIRALITSTPLLARMVEREMADALHLTNRVSIEVHSANYRSVRGYTIVAAIIDEAAFLPTDDAAEPDTELIAALEPAMATVPGALLLMISSPYARRGAFWQWFADRFGKDNDPVFVWQAATRTMNATVPQELIDAALEQDEAIARSEYFAEWRRDIDPLFSPAAVDAVVVSDRHELPPLPGAAYSAFVDPSGGSADSMTLGIAHRAESIAVLDLVREVRPPFSPEMVVAEFAATLKPYGITKVTGDRYGGVWVAEAFRKHGIEYEPAELTASQIYLEALPVLNSRQLELIDHPRLISQLVGLDRRVGRSGKDAVTHRANAHDDLAVAACGALVTAVRSVGLKASWPADFTYCAKATNGLPPCVLLYGRAGTYHPSDPFCFRSCPGLKVARPAYRRHIDAGGQMAFGEFISRHFDTNDFLGRLREAEFIDRMGL
jgi:hypothetical protein